MIIYGLIGYCTKSEVDRTEIFGYQVIKPKILSLLITKVCIDFVDYCVLKEIFVVLK